MRRRTLGRDILGTALMLAVLVAVCVIIIFGEHFLENFKAH